VAAAVVEIPLSQLLEEARAYEKRVPLEGTLETTYRCNLNCVHCYVNQPAASAGERARELPLERLKQLIDEIAEEGCLDLLLTGGEVLLRPDFAELYLHAVRAGLRVTVFTNGTMVTVTSNDPLFAGVNLPPQPGRGQAQIITTKTLVIYGTGRNGQDNPPQLYAVDQATGKQVGAVKIPSRTTAMPMTFLHQGRQYIVFATGAGANTLLVALRLPGK